MKSSESLKNHIAECQVHKRALQSVDQSQEYRMADSKPHMLIKRPLKFLKIPRNASRLKLNAIVKIDIHK